MSALEDALLHPANRPGPLVRRLADQVNPAAELRGLEDGGGAICDFRPDLEERNASLSISMGGRGAVFHRFGGDGFTGGAVDFTAECLNVSKREAVRLLIDWAGIVDKSQAGSRQRTGRGRPTAKAASGVARQLSKLDKLKPLEDQEIRNRLRGWVKLEAGEDSPEAAELARRGLLPALASGLLTAYRFTGRDGEGRRVNRPRQILPGAVDFEVRGPDGTVWALKFRNPDSREEPNGAKAQRYGYLGKGQGTPAWCTPDLPDKPAEVIVEGELNGAAVALALEAAGYGGAVGVQGVAGAESRPHVSHITPGREVFVYADPDPAGDRARQTWAGLLAHQGAHVRMLPAELFGRGDACKALPVTSPEDLGERLMEAIHAAPDWEPPREAQPQESGEAEDVWISKREGFGIRDGWMCALTRKKSEDGEEYVSVEPLTNFTAFITAQITQEDGTGEAARVFEVEGTRSDGRPMNPPRAMVPGQDFANMAWIISVWGAGAIVRNGQGRKDKAREAIQHLSDKRGIEDRTEHQHTGWIQHPKYGPVYLTAGAVIGAAGAVEGVDVELPGRLKHYVLPDPVSGDVVAAVRASLALLELAPDSVGVPVLGAVYRAPLGRMDATVLLTGETGRNKTALLALGQAHYGAGWNRGHLPDAWNSSANALEKSAFTAKDALFLIDDVKPGGGQVDIAKAQATVARILQGVADGQGRATLTADRKARAGLYPRGLVMSSSETLPRGHSNRARTVIVDVPRPLIGKDPAKSAAYYRAEDQAAAGVYALALAGYVQTIAAHFERVKVSSTVHRTRVRALAPRFEGAHGRTGNAAAELAYGWEVFLSFAVKVGALSEDSARALWARVVLALQDTARGQGEHLTVEDPVNRALSVLGGLLAQGRVYLEDLREGGPPSADAALMVGYQRHTFRTSDGETGEDYRPRHNASLLGWYSRTGGDEWAHFLPDALHEALQRAVQGQSGAILPDAGTLWANMRDRLHPAGLMRCDKEAARGLRPTAKATIPDRTRKHLITLRLPLSSVYETLGTLGTVGTDGEEGTSGTALSPVPITLYFLEEVGTVGTVRAEPSGSSFAGSLPSADLEYGGEIDGEMLI